MANDINRLAAMIIGYVLVAVGILGFFLTPTLIIFGVNTTHNIIHLLTGAALLIGAYWEGGVNARIFNMVLGAVYLLVALLGFANVIVPTLLNTAADAVPQADNVLHLLLGVVLVGVSFAQRTTVAPPIAGRPL